ncbi:MAG: diacylglycerol kinase family protein [Nitrospirota bacterium]
MKSSVIIISNPVAKRASGKKVNKAFNYLRSQGYNVEVSCTEQKNHAEHLAKEAIRKSPALIIAAGGDGTFNEVINGVAGTEIPVAILPMGTTNVLAKELDIPENVIGAMKLAVTRTPRKISLGKIIIFDGSSQLSRYFILMAGIGFDGEAVRGLNERFKKISGKGAYIFSGIQTLIRFRPEELTLSMEGKNYTGYSAVVGKAAKYGGHFKITPDAKLTDPALYVCVFKSKRRVAIIRYFFGVLTGSHLRFKDVEYIRTDTVKIKGRAHVQLDGDYFGMTPAELTVAPHIANLIF